MTFIVFIIVLFNRFLQGFKSRKNLIVMRGWRNWQTRKIQVLMEAIPCGFKSRSSHQTRIKRTREKILSSFYFIQEIILDLKSNNK